MGDVNWLRESYGFSTIASSVDELVILDVSLDRSPASRAQFLDAAGTIGELFFAPIAVGGRISNLTEARTALSVGAEKVVLNTALIDSRKDVLGIVEALGSQAVVGSVDLRRDNSSYRAFVADGHRAVPHDVPNYLEKVLQLGVGELLLNSIDQDGTGMGFDLDVLHLVPANCVVPIVIMGGAGTAEHLKIPLSLSAIDGVATGNLFNFVGDGLPAARARLIADGQPLASFAGVVLP